MRGMGRTYQRGPIWWIAYYFNGAQKRESSNSERESDAVKLLKGRLGEIGKGKLIGPTAEKVTFKQMADDLLTDYKINKKRSIRSADLSVRHLATFFGMDKAVQIKTDRIKKYIEKRQLTGAADGSINRELAALSRMFGLAIEAQNIEFKPHIPRLEENNVRQGFLDHGTFLNVVENLPAYLKDPVWFLYQSGWRLNEMRTLEWRDVDLPEKSITLRPENSKNKKSRFLSLRGRLLEIVQRAHKDRRLDCRFVFHNAGQPIGDFRKSWHNACVAAGVGVFDKAEGKPKRYRGLIIHDLRRTAVRNMIRAGVREKTAMERSGHRTRNVFDRYNIITEEDQAEASQRMDVYLDEQPTASRVVAI